MKALLDDTPPWLQALASPYATPSPEEAAWALARVDADVRPCTLCPELARTRTQTVFGTGTPTPRLIFVGEAPGVTEDQQGEPFVGEAGQLLTRILASMGFRREDVYICNVIKCHPPENRKPHADEIRNCRPYLAAQLKILRPEIICCLGATAAQALLGVDGQMAELRGQTFEHDGVPVLCTYHPAYLLRMPDKKREVWEDMQKLLRHLELPLPGGG